MTELNNNWEYTDVWSEDFLRGKGHYDTVRLPHSVCEAPLHYASPALYEKLCGYRREFTLPITAVGKRVFLQFDGAAHLAEVFVNGSFAGAHKCGYTAFRVEITELVHAGNNTVAVKLDCRESCNVPPFGFVIDYLTYGGLYREVWLDIREKNFIEDVFVCTPESRSADVEVTVNGEAESVEICIEENGKPVWGPVSAPVAEGKAKARLKCKTALLWSPESPKLYTCRVSLGKDTSRVAFGFRTVRTDERHLLINGKKVFLRGLNRHQAYPYMGYAAPEHLQREDARILKEELGVNAVRTSHYPQSQYFIDECDRLGLLVFTEIPGWQHIGNGDWKAQAVENTREMVMQYRNHPSVVLWGVRINESADDDELYALTNAQARALDPSRPTSGVRFTEKSHLLEDVYAYNDFSHDGITPGAKPKKTVTPDMKKPLLISEHNGHMFPTKSYDPWQKRQEQALRHGRVLGAALADGDHAGCFGWCMFDYPTHKDFGSGDRVCYHGVTDAFRNPKTAAALYASQSEERPVLEIGSPMDIGDYSAGNLGDVYIFTNADSVELYKNGKYVTAFTKEEGPGLAHPPIKADDFIGKLLETEEGFSGAKERLIHECLQAAGKYGLANLPLKYKAELGRCMLQYKLSFEDGVALYGKYVGNWGGEATRWKFVAIKDGAPVAEKTCSPSEALHLELIPSKTVLTEGECYDMLAVRMRVADENGNTACYAQLPLRLELSGPGALAGPDTVTAEGGLCGTYIKSVGKKGRILLKVSAPGLESAELEIKAEA